MSSFGRFVDTMISNLKTIIWDMDFKRRGIFVNWLKRHNQYLVDELTFNSATHIAYKRGMVVHVDFGFRVGAEYGGFHWAAIIQNDKKSAQTVVVVPLSSVKTGQTVHPKDADLGVISGLNTNNAEALMGQITTISKMRIQPGQIYKLTNAQLDEIDRKILDRYVNPTLKKKLI
ncbi:type II toxin-antitoxin system PemK/MazF family toxin [Priestia megaterium]|uniref:type II toxin-antitoxin system PemK/MazF family toxin n=1 Tax=Priestia megaterium TaxID=1404 RepID=UPI0030091C5B